MLYSSTDVLCSCTDMLNSSNDVLCSIRCFIL